MTKWEEMLKDDIAWLKVTARRFIDNYKNADKIVDFDSKLFYKIVEKLTALDSGKIVVGFFDGTEIECEIK